MIPIIKCCFSTLRNSACTALEDSNEVNIGALFGSFGVAPNGIREVLVCSSLENLIREILKGAGIQGGSSHSGRRTLATWLDRKGCDLELIRYILNHEDPEMTIGYIDPSQKRIEQAYKEIMKGIKIRESLK